MEAPFSPGQKVVAIKSWAGTPGYMNGYNAGDVFTVNLCKKNKLIQPFEWHCNFFERSEDEFYYCKNFAPIEYKDFTAEIAAGSTETKEQPDKVIIPAKPEAAPCENTFS